MKQDPYRRARIVWFTTMNLIAVVLTAALFGLMFYGDAIDGMMNHIINGVFEYKLVVVLVAMSPLLASLLVGMAYTQRALRRKRAQAASAASPGQVAAAPR